MLTIFQNTLESLELGPLTSELCCLGSGHPHGDPLPERSLPCFLACATIMESTQHSVVMVGGGVGVLVLLH